MTWVHNNIGMKLEHFSSKKDLDLLDAAKTSFTLRWKKGGSVPFNPHLSKEEVGGSDSFPGSRAGGERPHIPIAAFHSVLSKGGAVYMCVNRRLHTNSESSFHSKHFQVQLKYI